MNVIYIAVGHELLTPGCRETNGDRLACVLKDHNLALTLKVVVPDDVPSIRRQLEAAGDGSLVVLSGGLGPTQDDLTREALAEHLGVSLAFHEDLWAEIRAKFAHRGIEPPDVNRRQAYLPEGATPVPNPVGTAPGICAQKDHQVLYCFPGVPAEFQAVMEQGLVPFLCARGLEMLHARTFRLSGCFESQVEQKIQPFYENFGRQALTILAGAGETTLHLRHSDPRTFFAMEQVLRDLVRDWHYGGEDDTLEGRVVSLLQSSGWSLAVGESCTGGALAARIIRVPGASEVFIGGIVAYSNEAKTSHLGVGADLLRRKGAVSGEVALAMAQGARRAFRTAVGVGVTGIAGPTGGTPEKPVGTVFAAVAAPELETGRRFRFSGERVRIQTFAVAFILDLLRRTLA